ncbi:putative transporter [Rhodopila sp.]|uniref:putative transporter n=1 Tax=Rhodopila sp. TaxID=2480087 RepID=UPI002BEEF28E|nr:putative transporter [Rhodopila sp.]HVZ09457.1 putative transporter [Rhodopila sp.]
MFRTFFLTKRWFPWSVPGSALILFATWYKVELDVQINDWFGAFYNLIQKALGSPGSITMAEYFAQLATFGWIAGLYVVIGVLTDFFVKHYIFRWRTAMTDFYTGYWPLVRGIEGASQRVQEDTARFSRIMEGLGISFVRSVMTLFAFLPILWGFSAQVKELPWIGPVNQALVWVAIVFALAGTVALALIGFKLPGLEFQNQLVEAAYRKELVHGEDDHQRAHGPLLTQLFGHVRRNNFRMFFHYMYFDVAKWSYLQVGVLVPYVALGPTVVAGGITLGLMQQVVRAFGRVEASFQYLVNSWATIIELISVYKRLRAFERLIRERERAGALEVPVG